MAKKIICILFLVALSIGVTLCSKKPIKYRFDEFSSEDLVVKSEKLNYKYNSEGIVAVDDQALLFQALYDLKRGRLPEAEKKLMLLIKSQEKEKGNADFEVYYELSLLKHRVGKYDEAKIYAQRAEDLAETENQFENLYKMWITLGESQKAMAVLERGFEKFPQSQSIFRTLVVNYFRTNQRDLAIKVIQRYIEKNPADVSVLILYADVLMELGRVDEAKKIYEKIISEGHFDESVVLQLLKIYKSAGEIDKALDFVKANKVDKSTSVSLLREVVEIFLDAGNDKEAVSIMKRVTELVQEPEVLLDWINVNFRAKYYQEVVNSADAVRDLLRDQDQKDLITLMKAYSLHETKRYKEAISEFEKVGERSKFFANATAGKIESLKEIDLEEAVKFAGRISIDSPEIAQSILSLYREKEDYVKSLELIDEFIQKFESKASSFLYSKAIVLYEAGRIGDALAVAEDLVKQDENNPNSLNLLGYLLLELLFEDQKNGKMVDNDILGRAGKLIEQALKRKSMDPYIIDSIGWFYFIKGDIDIAERYIRQALEKLPEDPAILFHLGEIYYKKKEFEKALEMYKRASKAKPKGIEKRRIEERISEVSKILKPSRKKR